MNFLKSAFAFLLGHASALEIVGAKIYGSLGADILTITPQERGSRITHAVKDILAVEYPQYAKYEGIVIDAVYARIRAALAK